MKNEKTVLNCIFCSFWCRFGKDSLYQLNTEKIIGHCRIDQPKVTNDSSSHWPMTFENDWCGKFESKPMPIQYTDEDNPRPRGTEKKMNEKHKKRIQRCIENLSLEHARLDLTKSDVKQTKDDDANWEAEEIDTAADSLNDCIGTLTALLELD